MRKDVLQRENSHRALGCYVVLNVEDRCVVDAERFPSVARKSRRIDLA